MKYKCSYFQLISSIGHGKLVKNRKNSYIFIQKRSCHFCSLIDPNSNRHNLKDPHNFKIA